MKIIVLKRIIKREERARAHARERARGGIIGGSENVQCHIKASDTVVAEITRTNVRDETTKQRKDSQGVGLLL